MKGWESGMFNVEQIISLFSTSSDCFHHSTTNTELANSEMRIFYWEWYLEILLQYRYISSGLGTQSQVSGLNKVTENQPTNQPSNHHQQKQMSISRDYLPMMLSEHSDLCMTFGDSLSLCCIIQVYCPSSTIPAFNNCKVHLFISILVRFMYLGLRLSCFSWP